ncbi:MAG: M48 family metallopeptidase [Proteobacteria bacterium]|nr:M48 family metallopeptidase [Pseudomonadota bacterium]
MSDSLFIARFFDGKSLRPYQAQVEILPEYLLIKTLEPDVIEITWPWNKIKVMEPPHSGRDIVIGCSDMAGARLLLKDVTHYKAILNYIPPKNIKLSSVEHPWHRVMIIVVAFSVLLTILLVGIPLSAPFISRHVPETWDDELGQFVVNGMSESGKECVSPNGVKALQKMVGKLSKGSTEKFDVKVIKAGSEDINAFAAPGNHVIILSGLLDFANSPDEVAGVLAHEMGHAIEHHPTQGLIRTMGINIVMYSSFGTSSDYVTKLLHLKYSRTDEQTADDIGVALLKNANISTEGFVKFFEKLAQEHNLLSEHEKMLEYFSSHPGMMERMENIKAQGNATTTTPSLTTQEWQDLKTICTKTKALAF